ncbi:MAG: alkaline phosphatase family protein [Deltaproteobacteria bacterium]|nr:alkaline phosphatase family protein [Deltaproteobacteria bacterium]
MASDSADHDDDGTLTRRRTLQGMGAVLGSVTLGCGDDGSPAAGSGSGSDSGSGGGTADSTVDGTQGGTEGDTDLPPIEACGDAGGLAPEELLAEIDTIVVVMMENRSFDHFFGSATFLEDYAVNGLDGSESNLRLDGRPVSVFPLENLNPEDPPHGWVSSHLQWNNGANDGFVTEHELNFADSAHEVMGYHVRAQLPILYTLADNYVLCDNWYASVMGPTWPNRFYLNAATSAGTMTNEPVPGLTTIWDLLQAEGISANDYYSDLAWLWGGLSDTQQSFVLPLDEFFDAAEQGNLPAFSVVEPNYGLLPGSEGGNDDHPIHSIELGQVFLGSVYAALAQSAHWERCLLIITYDEHGGFYDHVSPPGNATDDVPDFQQLGFRVPSVVIGPHVRRGCVDGTQLDHVSPIATVTRRFGLPLLNERVGQTADVSSAIDPAFLGDPQPPAPIPVMSISVDEVMSKRGTGQDELAQMLARGDIQLPPDRRHDGAGRQVALRLLDRAQKLGVVKLRP